MKITINKKIFAAGLFLVAFATAFFTFYQPFSKEKGGLASQETTSSIQTVYTALPESAKNLYYKQSEGLTKPVPERLIELDKLTIGCFAPRNIMQMSVNDPNLGGQCCGVLKNFESYNLQLAALQEFIKENGDIELIPKDPYDIPVEHAQKLIEMDNEIILSAKQQQIYDEAVRISHHGGPCCCKCWKWYMMSGLGKKLIVDYGFKTKLLAQLWDLSSSCGHDEDVDMYKHYR